MSNHIYNAMWPLCLNDNSRLWSEFEHVTSPSITSQRSEINFNLKTTSGLMIDDTRVQIIFFLQTLLGIPLQTIHNNEIRKTVLILTYNTTYQLPMLFIKSRMHFDIWPWNNFIKCYMVKMKAAILDEPVNLMRNGGDMTKMYKVNTWFHLICNTYSISFCRLKHRSRAYKPIKAKNKVKVKAKCPTSYVPLRGDKVTMLTCI